MMNTRSTVVGVFSDRTSAEDAINELRRRGFTDDQIGFAMRGATAPEGATTADGSGAATGAITGGVLGGIAGAVAAGLIPGVGPLIAGGILAVTLGGAAAGAAAGGLLGALAEMGVPEEEAHYYHSEYEAGRILVTVRADGRYDEAWDVLRASGAYDIQSRPDARTATGSTTAMGTEMDRTDTGMTDRFATPTAGSRPMNSFGDWSTSAPRFQQDWEQRYGSSGRRWEDAEPGYRYGHDMSDDERFAAREFADSEPELMTGYQDWRTRTGYTMPEEDGGWERMRNDVQEGWEWRRRSRTTGMPEDRERRAA
jgi:hypothetical protein